jgi:hypothetical protein
MLGLDLNPTMGAVEIGVTTSAVLFGVTSVQTYMYYHRFSDDPLKTKILVSNDLSNVRY